MGKYGDIQYLIDRPEPSEIFLQARQIAGFQLQEQFTFYNKGKEIYSSNHGFKWIKAELTYPSFEHLTFAYKNSVYAVVIELIENTETSCSIQQKERLLIACTENNLIPCLFKVNIQEANNKMFKTNNSNYSQDDFVLNSVEQGWNLFDPISNKRIDPLTLSSEEPAIMSKWELSNFAIQIVIADIVKEENQILSFCDMPEINPQIWYKSKEGRVGWIIVKHITNDGDLDYKKWVGLEQKNEQLLPYDGYYALVQFESKKSNSMMILNRGDQILVNYKGLERIYVS
jgi:hypothetical protein